MAEDSPPRGLRGCTGTTRKGLPCAAWPLKDRDVCLAHADEETRASARFGGVQPGGGRPRVPRSTELQRDLAERHAAAMWRPHFKALGIYLNDDGTTEPIVGDDGRPKGAVIVHNGVATDIEDLGAQQAAAERIADRVFGRPKQATEFSGHIEHAVTGLEALSDEELLARLAEKA